MVEAALPSPGSACPVDLQSKMGSEAQRKLFQRRPREARAILRDALRREIAAVRHAVEAFKAGSMVPLDRQVPYVNQAVNILKSQSSELSLKVNTSTSTGEDKLMKAQVWLSDNNCSQQAEVARLALYLLRTKGRLSKVENSSDSTRFDIGVNLYNSDSHEMTREKREYLANNEELCMAKKVRSLCCSKDPEWTARLLQVIAPRLEWITVNNIGPEHMRILSTMPRLRRLRLWLANDDFAWDDFGPFQWDDEGRFNVANNDPKDSTRPFWFEELSADSTAGIVRLKADMPRQVILPLIVQHRRTLRELTLDVALPPQPGQEFIERQERRWVRNCHDVPQRLAELLERFSFPSLRLVVLWRLGSHFNDEEHAICGRQVRAVRRVFGPKVTVLCASCG